MNKDRVLGKGLSALIQGADLKGVGAAPIPESSDSEIVRIPIDDIGFNVNQPRKQFDDNKLGELADSIRQVGILQPVLIRRLGRGERAQPHPHSIKPTGVLTYSVVAGERRVRAARLAGMSEVPALICSYAETEALKVALLENIQREDLGPVEEATAFRNLMDAYGATQEELAEMLGKKRSSVANALRILTLEKEVLELLTDGKISRGHAKALLGMPAGAPRIQLAKICHSRGLSVRDCERRVQAGGARPKRKTRSKRRAAGSQDPAIKALMDRAEQTYGSPVIIDRDTASGKGTISVRFFSDSDLVRVLKIMGVDTDLS